MLGFANVPRAGHAGPPPLFRCAEHPITPILQKLGSDPNFTPISDPHFAAIFVSTPWAALPYLRQRNKGGEAAQLPRRTFA